MGHQRPHADGDRPRHARVSDSAQPRSAERRGTNDARNEERRHAQGRADEQGDARDLDQGYSQDSGYPQSGGYEGRPADQSSAEPNRERDASGTHEQSQIRIHVSDELDAPPYTGSSAAHNQEASDSRGQPMARAQRTDGSRTHSDESIRALLHELLAGRASPRGVLVTVENGNVTLDGEVAEAAEKAELDDMVRTSPGVRSVINRINVRTPR